MSAPAADASNMQAVRQTVRIVSIDHPQNLLRTGDRATVVFEFIAHPEFVKAGMKLLFREGKTKVGTAYSRPTRMSTCCAGFGSHYEGLMSASRSTRAQAFCSPSRLRRRLVLVFLPSFTFDFLSWLLRPNFSLPLSDTFSSKLRVASLITHS